MKTNGKVNRRLRPKLLSDLKPGTRVVSHNHDMGDWTPLKTLNVRVPQENTILKTLNCLRSTGSTTGWCRRRTSR